MGLVAALRQKGQNVALIDPQENTYVMGDYGWLDGLELIVGRGRSQALLCLLGWAESRGCPAINTRAAIAAVHNKANMAVAFAAGGIPTPRTFFGSTQCLARDVAKQDYPIILKPIFGDNSQGLLVVNTPEEMAATQWPEPAALAQRYHPGDGFDLKLYGIGEEIWAVRKASPFNGPKEKAGAELLPLTPELEDLGRRCGKLFGLELYGVDCIETTDGPLVIEVNDYPNYTGVPEANERLAEYVIRRGN